MLLNLGSFGFVAADTPYGQQHFKSKIIAWLHDAIRLQFEGLRNS